MRLATFSWPTETEFYFSLPMLFPLQLQMFMPQGSLAPTDLPLTATATSGPGRRHGVGKSVEDIRGADCAKADDRCEEVFRIQPMNNGSALGGLSLGVGRVNSTLQPNNNPAPNAQNLVANGLAFNAQGNLLVADTARGALWLVTFDKSGNLVSKLGCDDTFSYKYSLPGKPLSR